jgi:glyoxylase-like metal-dependent hydrolase (beta-lactamase superfamily II)
MTMQTYKDRILVETEYIGANVSCIITQKGLVLIDSPFLPPDAREWAEKIKAETGQEIAYLINTDHHYDHVMGNTFLTENTICHEVAAKGMGYLLDRAALKERIKESFPDVVKDFDADFETLKIITPHISFQKKMILNMGDATINLEFAGGHSPGTILIHFEEEKAVFTGDNVEGQFPFLGQARFKPWREILDKILSMDIDLVIPGHGPVGGKEMVEKYVVFFRRLEDEVREFKERGLSVNQMVQETELTYFFPEEGQGEFPRPWIENQYKYAVQTILQEI